MLTSPVLRCLKQQVEGAEIHFVTKKANRPLIEANPHIDHIHVLEDNFYALIQQLKMEGFDYVIDLHRSIRSQWIKSRLRIMAFTVDKINFRKFLMIRLKINRLPEKHIVDRYLETLRLFDVKNDGKGLEYFIPEKDEVNLSDLPDAFRKGYIAFVIGAQHGTKRMPADKIVDICKNLEMPVVLLGGPREEATGREIEARTGDLVWNAAGKYAINQSASLIRQSRLVITHDTGLMHIAAAYKKKILSIWGHTIPEFGMYPYQPDPDSRIFETKGLSCRPCTKTGKEECPKGHFRCILDIDNEEITRSARALF